MIQPPPPAAAPPGPLPAEEPEGPDIRDFLAMLHRHRWAAALVLVLVVSVGALHTYRQVPVYSSTPALLEITSDGAGIATVRDVFEREYLSSQNFETLVQVLKSEGILRAAYENAPEARARMDFGQFAAGVTASPVRNSFLIRITFDSPWPEVNPAAANAVARSFITTTRDQRAARTSRAGLQLQKRRDELRQALEQAEKRLADFRTTHQKADVRAEKESVDGLLAQFEAKYDQQQLELVALEKARDEVAAARRAGNLAQVTEVLSHPQFQEIERDIREAEAEKFRLLKGYTETSNEVKLNALQLQSLAERRERLIQAVVAKIEATWEGGRAAVEKIREFRDERRLQQQELARLLIEQTNLEGDRDRIRRDLDDVVKQTSEVQGTVGFDLSPAILHEEARLSPVQVRPRPARDLTLAVFLGLLLAVGTAYLLEQFNDAATRPEEVSRATGLPVLGMLPRLSPSRDHPDVAAMEDPKGEMAEAVRIIRTAILFTPSGRTTRRRILVTSAEAGEGKTLLSTNLAAALAQAGQRTLLVDSDLRRPRLHEIFGLDNEKGLTHIFSDGQMAPPAHRIEGAEGLEVLTSGPIPPNPAELLGGERMGEFLDRGSGGYDRVVLDSPPAGPVSDPALLARQVDGVLLVVQLGKTSIRAVRRACDHLQKVGAPMLGVVLNGISMGGGYYYHHYYRRYGYPKGGEEKSGRRAGKD